MHSEQQLLKTGRFPFSFNESIAHASVLAKNSHQAENLHGLIDKARSHSLGMDFFCNGYLEAVAIVFETDVFEVDAARALLNTHPGEDYGTACICNCL